MVLLSSWTGQCTRSTVYLIMLTCEDMGAHNTHPVLGTALATVKQNHWSKIVNYHNEEVKTELLTGHSTSIKMHENIYILVLL
jgi:hypothetical protein